ncbi:testis specific protein Y-linked isoform X2 [Scleropages formosus]|uniref:Testis specific protein Y-linked n=1 Tax=Scleropages formosus TaxID=113540 RepID=A0A8C9S9W3_SCLFO|nr:testis-specific Y-encoded-like protein 1 isoform X2 [Scleropages formosus]
MSEVSNSSNQATEMKRSSSSEPGSTTSPPMSMKTARIEEGDFLPNPRGLKNGNTDDIDCPAEIAEQTLQSADQNMPSAYSISTPASSEAGDAHPSTSGGRGDGPCSGSTSARAQMLGTRPEASAGSGGMSLSKEPQPCVPAEQSDWAAMAAAEALASLTHGGEDQQDSAGPVHPSKQVVLKKKRDKKSSKKNSPTARDSDDSPTPGKGHQTHAAAADSSTSSLEGGIDRSRVAIMEGDEEDDDEDNLLSDTSSSPSSSSASDDDGNGDDTECAIVSVKMAPEMRQSVALLAQVQMRLEALEKKATRLHQQVDLKFRQQRRPHLDQRSAIIQGIPGFWVTTFLNHPQLSSHIDETDEDALSYMTNLEVESFKSSKLGYRIAFHFGRNAYFQNSIIVKEFHPGVGGSMLSFSNPILWHRGKNLTTQSQLVKESGSSKMYTSFFSWFSDHSNPGRDEIAEILKDDLYRNPLRYYLTPLWEPRQNGSGHQTVEDSEGNECVVISDSDEEETEGRPDVSRDEDEEEEQDSGSGDSDGEEQVEEESSPPKKKKRNGKEFDESTSQETREQEEEEEEDVEVGQESHS